MQAALQALQAASPAGGRGASPLLSDSAVYSNALWLAESPAGISPASTAAVSPLRQPLKSLSAAATAAAASGPDADSDGAHLIAAPASRAASFDEQGPHTQLASRKQVVRGSAAASLDNGSSSPRIGAVTLHRHSSDSLGALVRHLSQRLLPGGRAEDAGAAAPPPQLHDAPPARCTPAAEASDGGSDLAGILPHVSPGHLLAPAQTSLWAGSPPPVQLQLMAASGESPPQQDALLDLDLLDDLLPAAQPVAGPAQQLSPQPQDETAALLLQQQLSDLSSPTSAAAAGHAAGAAAWEPAGAQQLGGLRPAWSLEGGHVELDLDLLEALPQAEPAAGSGTPTSTLSLALAAIPDAAEAGGWDHGSAHPLLDSPQLSLGHQQHDEQQQEEEQQCLVLYGPSMANQYTPMVLRFEELDTRRIRRAVKRSLKQQAAKAAAQQHKPSLFRRLTRGCFSGSTADQPLRLRKDLDRQRLQLLCLGRLPYSPDDPLHFELWQAVCWGFTGMDAIEEHPSEMLHGLPAWQLLGFRAANPASSLGSAGVLPLLMLLLGLDYASHLAARLLHLATAGALLPAHAQQAAERLPPFSLADVAVEVTRWTLHTLASGGLNLQAQRLGSATIAAELFWLGAAAEFVERWEAAEQHADPQRLLLSVLVQAQQAACSDVRGTVERHLRRPPQAR
ncbi:hypothetical protein COHA_009534 [Chlorella ohadii]|uniref:ELMO domain-containing protein n=1 Tax=Chlorella ohadii TaxID=2649997 RepID=A0AAD5DEN5_9CHLO|nr:hypothetical protein COHA_009534 [Chlorella ohadii]